MSSTSVVAVAGYAASTTQGDRHRRLQHQWWPLSDLPPAPPRGPTVDVFNIGGDRCWTCHQHPEGPTIDVFNFSGGRCRTCR
jgi:hypothetical protein